MKNKFNILNWLRDNLSSFLDANLIFVILSIGLTIYLAQDEQEDKSVETRVNVLYCVELTKHYFGEWENTNFAFCNDLLGGYSNE